MAAPHRWHVCSSRAQRDLGHGKNARRNLVNFSQRYVMGGIFSFWYRHIYSLSPSRCDGGGVKVGWIVHTPYDIVSIDMTLSLRFKLAASPLCLISHKIDTIAGPTGSASDLCRLTCFFKVYIELRTAWHPLQ
jgi:hypothetical protein